MKVLVIGSNGMAGHVITKYLRQQGHTVSTVAKTDASYCVDIENSLEVQSLTRILYNFDYVINCIGLLVKDSIARPDRAAYINGWFPHYLEYLLKNTRTTLIHLSTDCVFDGSKGNYKEDAIHSEMNVYGKSKSMGEVNNDKDVTFRMSIIGPEIKSNGTGLFNWIVTTPDKEINGWNNALWNGITTLELAKCIDTYMSNPIITGVYHLVNNDNKINKFKLLTKINKIFVLKKIVNETSGPKDVNKILVDTRQLIDFDIPDYDTMLLELKLWCEKHV
jgi:dTDP-4-dehydrorhamnose reductase